MREYICDNWQFIKEFDEAMLGDDYSGKTETVRVPHNVADINLWSPEEPYMYEVTTVFLKDGSK